MSSQPPSQPKWAGFFSKAMNNVEAHLDRVLDSTTPNDPQRRTPTPQTQGPAKILENERTRVSMQDRLAASMQKTRTPSPLPSQNVESHQRDETSDLLAKADGELSKTQLDDSGPTENQKSLVFPATMPEKSSDVGPPALPLPLAQPIPSENLPATVDTLVKLTPMMHTDHHADDQPKEKVAADDEKLEEQRQMAAQSQPQGAQSKDSQYSLRRIRELEEKLGLAMQALQNEDMAEHGSMDKRIHDKDRTISMLMQEGEKLSKQELKLNNTIKALRKRVNDTERDVQNLQNRLGKAEKERDELRNEAKARVSADKTQAELVKSLATAESEITQLRREKQDNIRTIQGLQTQLVQSKQDVDLLRVKEIKLDETQNQLALNNERANQLYSELQISRNQWKNRELSLQNELVATQSELEAFRSKAEEASTGISESAKARLLRQVETTQAQYSEATQNWLRMEQTLQDRKLALEKSIKQLQNDNSTALSNNRKLNLQIRTLQSEIEDTESHNQNRERRIGDQQNEILELKQRVMALVAAADESQTSWTAKEKEYQDSISALEKRIRKDESERAEQALPRSLYQDVPLDDNSRESLRSPPLNTSPFNSISADLGFKRNSATSLPRPTSQRTISSRRTSCREAGADAVAAENDYLMDEELERRRDLDNHGPEDGPFSPTQSAMSFHQPHDHSSILTAGGPSKNIGMIERLSATVRRLEASSAFSQEEITRLTQQRDQARQECSKLLTQVASVNKLEGDLKKNEQALAELTERYNTTLDVLGEKSERTDELQQDILDMKELYSAQIDDLVNRLNAK